MANKTDEPKSEAERAEKRAARQARKEARSRVGKDAETRPGKNPDARANKKAREPDDDDAEKGGKGEGKGRGKGKGIPKKLMTEVDDWRQSLAEVPTRREAVRTLLKAALKDEKRQAEWQDKSDAEAASGAVTLAATVPNYGVIDNMRSSQRMHTSQEAEELFNLAKAAATGCIVEIGSYQGASTVALCAGSSVGHKLPVFAIEPHEPFEGLKGGKFGPQDRGVFFRNLLKTGMYPYVRLLNTRSEIVTPGWQVPVSLLFIDGDHRYAAVKADYLAWRPHLAADAIVVFDDVGEPEVKRAVDEVAAGGELEFVRSGDTKMAIYRLRGGAPGRGDAGIMSRLGLPARRPREG